MLFVLRNAGMNAAIEDSFSQLLAWTLTNKFQSTGAEDYILKQKVLSLLEWVCVTYMFRMGLLLYVKNPSTPPTSCRKADKPPTPLSLLAVAKGMVYKPCCKNNCLATLSPSNDFNESVQMVALYLDDWYLLDKKEHRERFLDLLKAQTTGISFGGERQGQLSLRIGTEQFNVCRDAFVRAHNRGKTYYDQMVQHLKNGIQPDEVAVGASLVASLRAKGGAYGVKLDSEDFTAMNVGKTISSIRTVIWMDAHFKLVGDHVPNSGKGEIHLEKQEIKGIFNEYKEECSAYGRTHVLYGKFTQLWRECFPQVKIRAYKQVSGKCYTCLLLSYLRSKFKDPKRRTLVNELHAHHKAMYSKERMGYYKRAEMANTAPDLFWSDIIDGMCSSKTVCPSFKDAYEFKPALNMHIQGVLAHGRTLDIYRNFPNLKNTCNVAIHCWLLTLEAEYKEKGKLPDTIYHQIDGGSENTAKTVLAVSELLVAKRLTKKVVLTRLPVGHTHEDIDAVFGVIWSKVMNHNVLTPKQYKHLLLLSGREKEQTVKVVDLWSVPDYIKYFSPHINKHLGRYAKSQWSQLQIIFEATDLCERFPLGVKVRYRPYSSDNVSLIKKLKRNRTLYKPPNSTSRVFNNLENLEEELAVHDSSGKCLFPGIIVDECEESNGEESPSTPDSELVDSIGYVPVRVKVNEHEAEGETFVLKELPTATVITPQPFVPGFRASLESVHHNVVRKLEGFGTRVAEDWKEFMSNEVPANEDAEDYHRRGKPLHVPFHSALFGITGEGCSTSTETLIALQHDVDLAAGTEARLSGFGPQQTYQSMPSMAFVKKGSSAPCQFALGDTFEAAEHRMKTSMSIAASNKKPVASKSRGEKQKGRSKSKTASISDNWTYESVNMPKKASNTELRIWSKVGKTCADDEGTWTIVDVVKSRGLLMYKYLPCSDYKKLKSSSDDHVFEYSACSEFFGLESDYIFTEDAVSCTLPPTRKRLKKGNKLVAAAVPDTLDEEMEIEEEVKAKPATKRKRLDSQPATSESCDGTGRTGSDRQLRTRISKNKE